jgi:hypothetical protein
MKGENQSHIVSGGYFLVDPCSVVKFIVMCHLLVEYGLKRVTKTHPCPSKLPSLITQFSNGIICDNYTGGMLHVIHLFFFCPPKFMWLLKLPLDQNSIMIYHKFNSNFKSHINFERIKGGQMNYM